MWQRLLQDLRTLAIAAMGLSSTGQMGNPGLHGRRSRGGIIALLIVVLLGPMAWLPGVALPAHATGIYEIPALQAGAETVLVDEAQVLSRLNTTQISGRLKDLERTTGVEIRFVTFRRLDYEVTIQQFTQSLFEQWYPTPEAQANQILIALDVVSNTVGIQVGPEVPSSLTPAIAQSITQETMLLPMRKGEKYNQAMLDATERLSAVLSGQVDPGPPTVVDTVQVEGTFATPEETKNSNGTIIVIVLLIVATVVPMVTYFMYVR